MRVEVIKEKYNFLKYLDEFPSLGTGSIPSFRRICFRKISHG